MIVGGNRGIVVAIPREDSHRCSGSSRGRAAATAAVVATDAFADTTADPIGTKQIVRVVDGSGNSLVITGVVALFSFGVGFHDGPNEIRRRPVSPRVESPRR